MDAADIMAKVAKLDISQNFNFVAGDATRNGDTDLMDAADIMAMVAKLSYSYSDLGKADSYIGGNVAMSDLYEKDPIWESTTEPDEDEKLATPIIDAVAAQEGYIYYSLESAVAGAEAYEFYVGETKIATETAISGSFEYAYTEGMEITVVATTTVSGYINSDPSDPIVVNEYEKSTALAEWLEANGLEDVVITVYEITE